MPAAIYLVLMIGCWLIKVMPMLFNFLFRCFCRYCLAGFFTPPGHRRYGDFYETVAYRDLTAEGYGVEPRFAMDAVVSIRTD
jgi:hypothetical protein